MVTRKATATRERALLRLHWIVFSCTSCLGISLVVWANDLRSTGQHADADRGSREDAPPPPPSLRPSWMVARDCSVFDVTCFMRNNYQPYPFDFSRVDYNYNAITDLPPLLLLKPQRAQQHGSMMPQISNAERQCLAYVHDTPYDQQLDDMLAKVKRVEGWVAYTMTDMAYAQDMIHDVFDMAHNVVGFPDAFFVVAIDAATVDIACEYGYPVLPSPNLGDLENRVKLTKFQMALDLLKRNESFLFFEMDVWFTKSILPLLKRQWGDIMVSSHQNIVTMNIGVYSVRANVAARDYFQQCLEVGRVTTMHDQKLMEDLATLHDLVRRRELTYRQAAMLPNVTVAHPVQVEFMGAHEIVASAQLWPNGASIAVHVLCGAPLRNPHGKKMVAKELGVYHGSHGYYDANQRYIWLDSGMGNVYSLLQNFNHTGPGIYEHIRPWKWAMATMVYLAKKTNRIWIVPTTHWLLGQYFLWAFLDLKSVEDMGVDYRESGFLHNPKVGRFRSVSRTAFGNRQLFWEDDKNDIKVWNLIESEDLSGVDTFVSMLQGIDSDALLVNPQFVDNAWELRARSTLRNKPNEIEPLARSESEILELYKQLKWCHSDRCSNPDDICHWEEVLEKHTRRVTIETAEGDCYGKGTTAW